MALHSLQAGAGTAAAARSSAAFDAFLAFNAQGQFHFIPIYNEGLAYAARLWHDCRARMRAPGLAPCPAGRQGGQGSGGTEGQRGPVVVPIAHIGSQIAERASARRLAGALPCGAVEGRRAGGNVTCLLFPVKTSLSGAGETPSNAAMAHNIWRRISCTQGIQQRQVGE